MVLSGLVGLTAPHPDGCRADKSGSPQSESWSRLRFGPVLVLEAPLGAPRVVGANVQIGRWGFAREGECRKGREAGEGYRKGRQELWLWRGEQASTWHRCVGRRCC